MSNNSDQKPARPNHTDDIDKPTDIDDPCPETHGKPSWAIGKLDESTLINWATDTSGPVALHATQRLVPIDLEHPIVFPPTYADIGYNIDTLADGSRVAVIDSVGSQANRLESLFKNGTDNPVSIFLADLVPQIQIALQAKAANKGKGRELVALFDLAHRAADAVVYSCPSLSPLVESAFSQLRLTGNSMPLCLFAPTSLLFGVWDSRGDSGEKRPRLVRSVIRAWDVEPLHGAAQFNSIAKSLSQDDRDELAKEAKANKRKLSEAGFADSPAIFRKTNDHVHKFANGIANPDARILGGVLCRGAIERTVTINLIALRALRGGTPDETRQLQKYLLALALLVATTELDLFLREGCLLQYANTDDDWRAVPRRGDRTRWDIGSESAQGVIREFAKGAVAPLRPGWPEKLVHDFDLKAAKKLLAKKKAADVEDE